MKVALLHLDLSAGPEETNLERLSHAIRVAAREGASWIITPETALQGYFFAQQEEAAQAPVQPNRSMRVLSRLAAEHSLTMFVGCAEQDALTGKYHNSCLVIGPEGQIIGRHRKIQTHQVGAEAWISPGERADPINCSGLVAGVLICADSWFMEHVQILKDRGAEIIVILAAWPPGEWGPGDCWERCSYGSGLPVWVCNQTGVQEQLDFSHSESAVVVQGKTHLSYSGPQPAVLLFDWDRAGQCPLSAQFTVVGV